MNRPPGITPSNFKRVMTGKLSDKFPYFTKTAQTYAREVAMHMIGVEPTQFESYDMQRGKDLEPLAIEAYEARNFVQVEEKGRITHPEYEFIHGEPDGIIQGSHIIEVKSPNQKNHLENVLENAQVKDYLEQMQGYLWLTGLDYCDFVSFNIDFPEPLNLHIVQVERDDKMIDEIEKRCLILWNELVMPCYEELQERMEAWHE